MQQSHSTRSQRAQPAAIPSILQWNCNGLRQRLPDLKTQLRQTPYDILLIQEPRIEASKLRIPGYTAYQSKPQNKPPWVAVLVRNDVDHSFIDLSGHCTDKAEFVGVRVSRGDSFLTLVSSYVHPKGRWHPRVLAQILASEPGEVIFGGDFNAHNQTWGDGRTTIRGRRLQHVLDQAGLQSCGSGEPTFFRPGVEGSVIDLTIASPTLRLRATPLLDGWGSDHMPITIGPAPRPPTKTCKVVDWNKYRDLLTQLHAQELTSEHLATALTSATRTVSVPAHRPNPDMRWLELRAKRRKAQRKARRTHTQEDNTKFRQLDGLFKRYTLKLMRQQWTLRCESFDAPRGATRAWHMARTLANKPGPQRPIAGLAIALGVNTASAVNMLANVLLQPPTPPLVDDPPYRAWRGWTPTTIRTMTGGDGDFEMWELEHALRTLPRKKSAPGPDGVTTAALRNIDPELRPALLEMLNKAWRDAVLPDSWRTAGVVPVLKPGKPASDPTSYRPIALTSCVGKLLEKMVHRRLTHHLETVEALPDCFYGFRRHRCTADAIADIATTLEEGKKKSWTTGVVLLDVSRAFDAVRHDKILAALCRCGVTGRTLRYVEAFLRDRTASVSASGETSSPRSLTCGVPQGSVLSPLLFSVALAALPQAIQIANNKRLKTQVQLAVYADDIALWSSARGAERLTVQAQLQKALNNTRHFLATLGLTLSASKSVVLCAAPHRTHKFQLELHLGGLLIPVERKARYLGITLDDKATWTPAVNDVIKAMTKHTSILRMLGGQSHGTSQGLLLQLYKGLILARPLYALPLLHLGEHSWARLERAQRRALRICLGVPPMASSRHTLNEAGMNTVRNAATERALRHLIRIAETPGATKPGRLWSRLVSRQRSGLGKLTDLLHDTAGEPGPQTTPPAPDEAPLRVEMEAGLRRPKRDVTTIAMRQLAEGHIEEKYEGWCRVYTDGSVDPVQRTAAAAAVTGSGGVGVVERLTFHASSTTAELVALGLGLDLVERQPNPERVVFLCDSKAALGHLRNPDRAPGLARSIVARVSQMRRQGWDFAYQWLPSHCGIKGNEAADRMAAAALTDADSPESPVLPFEDARLLIRRMIWTRQPELEIGPMPTRVPAGISRQTAAVLHRLRTDSARTPAARAKWQHSVDRNCSKCDVPADAEHLLLHCTKYTQARTTLQQHYLRLNGDPQTLETLLRPALARPSAERALKALALFVVQTRLCEQL